MAITPIHPFDVEGADAPVPADPTRTSRLTLGGRLPSRRTLGRNLPSRRTLGHQLPSRRTLGHNLP